MQRLFIAFLICLGFVLPATAQAWWQDDWHYRKQISVDTTPQGAAINQALGRTALLVRLCLLYTSPSPRDLSTSRMPSSA